MRSRSTTTALLAGLVTGLLASAPAAASTDGDEAALDKHPAVTVPAEIEFGAHPAATAVPGRVWLINRSDDVLHLQKIKRGCGCIVMPEFGPVELAPHTALPLEFTYTAPKDTGTHKTKLLTFIFRVQETRSVALTIGAASDDVPLDEPAPEHEALSEVITAPGALDFGDVQPESAVSGSAWLINTSERPRTVTGAKGDCGCITLHDFEPMTLGPREARLVSFTVKTPKKADQAKTTAINFTVADADPISLSMTMHSANPRVARSAPPTD